MTIPQSKRDEILNTSTFKIAKNKKSFIGGAYVAFNIAEKFYEEKIKALERTIIRNHKTIDETKGDINTIVSIFKKYDHE